MYQYIIFLCLYSYNITFTGRFSDKQKIVYNAVLKANRAVFEQAKPGVSWVDMHKLAEKVNLKWCQCDIKFWFN